MYSPSPNPSPDLHDWAYEQWSELANLRDTALESFAQEFKETLQTDSRCEIFNKVDEVMNEVLEGISNDTAKLETFLRLLFAVWLSPSSFWKIKALSELLEIELDLVISAQFKRNTDWH